MRLRHALPVLLLCLLAPRLWADDYAQREAELRAVQERIAALNLRLGKQRGQRDALSEALRRSEQAVAEARRRLGELHEELQRLRAATAAAEAEADAAAERLAAQQEALAAHLRAAARMGPQPALRLLLEQDAPARLQRLRAASARIFESFSDTLHETERATARHTEAMAELEQRRHKLQAAEEEQARAVTRLDRERAERERALAALEAALQDDRTRLEAARRNEKALQQLMGELRAALADIPADAGEAEPFANLHGHLAWPVDGRLLARFGEPKPGGLRWNGLWLAAPVGTPVRVLAAGRVAWAGWMHRYGLVVVVEHEGGYYSLYGHTQQSPRRVGEWLRGGDVVALAGDSGGQRRSGVYLELRKGAEVMDPVPWLKARSRAASQ